MYPLTVQLYSTVCGSATYPQKCWARGGGRKCIYMYCMLSATGARAAALSLAAIGLSLFSRDVAAHACRSCSFGGGPCCSPGQMCPGNVACCSCPNPPCSCNTDCTPQCDGKQCGSGGCGENDCGKCGAPFTGCVDNQCVCAPHCQCGGPACATGCPAMSKGCAAEGCSCLGPWSAQTIFPTAIFKESDLAYAGGCTAPALYCGDFMPVSITDGPIEFGIGGAKGFHEQDYLFVVFDGQERPAADMAFLYLGVGSSTVVYHAPLDPLTVEITNCTQTSYKSCSSKTSDLCRKESPLGDESGCGVVQSLQMLGNGTGLWIPMPEVWPFNIRIYATITHANNAEARLLPRGISLQWQVAGPLPPPPPTPPPAPASYR